MVDIYKTDNRILSKLGSIEEGCWINMVNPTSSELSLISGYFDIDADDLATALDDVTPEEYADMHDLKRDTVYKRLQRAKKKYLKFL